MRLAIPTLVAVLVLGLAPPLAAQDAPPPSPTSPQGLSSLDDDRVLTEIAGRGLEALLRHALEAKGVPDDERNALLAGIALSRLTGSETISQEERRQLVLDVTRNVDQMVTQNVSERNAGSQAQLLMQQAQVLIDQGVGEEVRLLEYFGENPERRRYVRPVAEAVGKMLLRAAELFAIQADSFESQITSSTDPRIVEAKGLRGKAQQARQLALFSDYYRLLGLDPSDPQRINLGNSLIERVQPLDSEENPSRAFVQQFLGKLNMARGNGKGITAARDYFEGSISTGGDVGLLFDSYFGRVLAAAMDRAPDEAEAQMTRFEEWFASNQLALAGREPLMLVARFRVADALSRSAESNEARQQAEAAARGYLTRLVDEFEGYRPIVTQQLLARVDDATDLSALPPLLLDAMVDRGRAEAAKLADRRDGEDDPDAASTVTVDEAIIEQGIASATELMRRAEAGDTQVSAALVARNAFLKGLMLQLLDRPIEAAEAYLGFGRMQGAVADQRLSAYRRALGIVDQLRRDAPGNAGGEQAVRVDAIEAELLPVLIDEFGDTTRAFDLANRLHRLGRLNEAVGYYAKVPDADPRKPDAMYMSVLAEAQRAADLPNDAPERASLLTRLPALGEATLARLEQAIAAAGSDSVRNAYQERSAQLRVTLARLALTEQDDAARALALLDGIEADLQGLPGAASILSAALPLRFQATAAAGRIDEATTDLLRLLEESDANRGLAFIQQFRETLNLAFERAEVRGDRDAMQQIMQTRANVTPKLVEWIEQSDDPEYRRYVYNFRRFNAETQLQVALLADEGPRRTEQLRAALSAYQELESADNLRRYRELLEGLSEAQRQQVPYDREVVLGLGRIHYALAEHEEARSRFARLLADRALGEGTQIIVEDGVEQTVPNDDFWEVHLKFIQSNLALGNAPAAMADQLRRLIVIHGDNLGGRRWQREFARLREQLLSGDGA